MIGAAFNIMFDPSIIEEGVLRTHTHTHRLQSEEHWCEKNQTDLMENAHALTHTTGSKSTWRPPAASRGLME